ncbi:MAG: CARDB domain-containing protein [Thermoplasmatota archaeon]
MGRGRARGRRGGGPARPLRTIRAPGGNSGPPGPRAGELAELSSPPKGPGGALGRARAGPVAAPLERCTASPLSPRSPGPDVAVLAISFDGPNPATGIYGAAMVGRPTRLTVTIGNSGEDPAPAVDVYLGITDYFSNSMGDFYGVIPSIPPGGEGTLEWTWTPGYVTTASVNATAEVPADTNLTNNTLLLTGLPVALWIDPCDSQGGWSGDIGPGRWQLVSDIVNDPDPADHSSPRAWYCGGSGAYANGIDASLISPPLDLTRMNPNYYVLLNFNYYGRSQQPDRLETYISDDGGATWYPLFATLSGTGNSNGWYDWVSHWSDYNGNGMVDEGEPHERGLDIMRFSGKVVRVKLRFVSDASFNDLGFYVDDFVVRGTGSQNDVALLGISASDVDRIGAEQTLTTTIRNIGQGQQPSFTVYLNVSDGTSLSRSAPPLAPGETAEMEWGWTPAEPGDYTIRCTLCPAVDDVASDNSLWRPAHVAAGEASVLVVDDDSGPGNNGALRTYLYADVDGAMVSALAPLEFDLFLVANDGDGPSAELLSRYGAVVWLTGFDDCFTSRSGTLSAADTASLASYLDRGGRLWLVSFEALWDIWTVRGDERFARDYLHIRSFSSFEDDAGMPGSLEGVPEDPIAGGLLLGATGPPPGLWDKSDILRNDSTAPGIFFQYPWDKDPIAGPFNALRFSDSFKLVFFGFEFSFIASPEERSLLASKVMEWLWGGVRFEPFPGGLEGSVEPGEGVAYNLSLVNTEPRGWVLEHLEPAPPSAGWNASTTPQVSDGVPRIELPPRGSLRVVLEVEAPEHAPAGRVEAVTVNARFSQCPYVLSITTRTRVLGRAGVGVSCDQPGRSVNPGEEASFNLLVQNTGNYDAQVNLSLSGDAAPWSRLSRASIFLSGGGKGYVQLVASVPRDALAGSHSVTVLASVQRDGGSVEDRVALTLEVNATSGLRIERVLGAGPLNMARSLQTFVQLEVGNYGNTMRSAAVSLRPGFPGGSGWSLPPETVELAPFERGRAVALLVGAPASAPAGTYDFTVRVGGPDGSVEDERPLSLSLVRPDLRVSPEDITVVPQRPLVDGTLEVSITVHNDGGGDVRSVLLAVLLNNRSIASLEIPQTILPAGSASLSLFHRGALYGGNLLEVRVDPEDSVLETDESNNGALRSFSGHQPDLSPGPIALRAVGGSGALSNQSVRAGLVEVSALVLNSGAFCADAEGVEVLLSVDGQPIETRVLFVPAGSRAEAVFVWSARRGSHQLKVIIDPEGKLGELSEDNNELELAVRALGEETPAEELPGWTLLWAGAAALLLVVAAIAAQSLRRPPEKRGAGGRELSGEEE